MKLLRILKLEESTKSILKNVLNDLSLEILSIDKLYFKTIKHIVTIPNIVIDEYQHKKNEHSYTSSVRLLYGMMTLTGLALLLIQFATSPEQRKSSNFDFVNYFVTTEFLVSYEKITFILPIALYFLIPILSSLLCYYFLEQSQTRSITLSLYSVPLCVWGMYSEIPLIGELFWLIYIFFIAKDMLLTRSMKFKVIFWITIVLSLIPLIGDLFHIFLVSMILNTIMKQEYTLKKSLRIISISITVILYFLPFIGTPLLFLFIYYIKSIEKKAESHLSILYKTLLIVLLNISVVGGLTAICLYWMGNGIFEIKG